MKLFSSVKLLALFASSQYHKSENPSVLNAMADFSGNPPFLRHKAQAFTQFVLKIALNVEDDSLSKTVKSIPTDRIPASANIMSSHAVHKLKRKDDVSIILKLAASPHGNEESDKHLLRSGCFMCPPSGFCIVTSITSLKQMDSN